MDVEMGSIEANGILDLVNGRMEVPEWLKETSKTLNWGVTNMILKPTKAAFLVKDGKMMLKDTITVALPKETTMRLGGHVTLDEKLNMGGTLIAKGKKLPFTITGTVKKPVMKVNWKALGLQVVAPVLDKAKEQALAKAREQADKLLKAAQEEADKVKAAAKTAAAKVRSEAASLAAKQKAEADKLEAEALKRAKDEADAMVNKATDPLSKKVAKAAADKAYQAAEKKAAAAKQKSYDLADKAVAEADAKADAMEAEANKKADKIMADAQAQADKTIADADAKATIK
jgi:hypothetical protein